MNNHAGDRIKRALDLRKMSIRALYRALDGKPGRKSYPMVHRYLTGTVNPPIPFLEAVAELLEVRLEWLTTGSGGITVAEERVQRARDAAVGIAQRRHAEEGIREAFPLYDRLSFITRNAVFQAWVLHFGRVYIERALGEIHLSDHQVQRELGRRIGRTLNAAMEELAIDPAAVHPVQLNNYVLMLATALFTLSDSQSVRMAADNNEWIDVVDAVGGMTKDSDGAS